MTPWLDGAGPVIEPPRIALRAAGDSELPIQAQHRAVVHALFASDIRQAEERNAHGCRVRKWQLNVEL
jgi:hypothetical protein